MSTYRRNLHVRSAKRRTGGRAVSRWFYLKATTLLGVIMLVLIGKIYLERTTTKMGLDWETKHRELSRLTREVDNLLVEREQLSRGDYILVHARNMGLRPSDPGQVHVVGALRRPAVAATRTDDVTVVMRDK